MNYLTSLIYIVNVGFFWVFMSTPHVDVGISHFSDSYYFLVGCLIHPRKGTGASQRNMSGGLRTVRRAFYSLSPYHGFSTVIFLDHFGVFWGYHHLRKHPHGDLRVLGRVHRNFCINSCDFRHTLQGFYNEDKHLKFSSKLFCRFWSMSFH